MDYNNSSLFWIKKKYQRWKAYVFSYYALSSSCMGFACVYLLEHFCA